MQIWTILLDCFLEQYLDIDLLTKEQYRKYKNKIKEYPCKWWINDRATKDCANAIQDKKYKEAITEVLTIRPILNLRNDYQIEKEWNILWN